MPLLPEARLETSPGRRPVVRRFLVTCLGDADEIFRRLHGQLRELSCAGTDGAAMRLALSALRRSAGLGRQAQHMQWRKVM